MIGKTYTLVNGTGPKMLAVGTSTETVTDGTNFTTRVTHVNLFWFDADNKPYEVRLPAEAVKEFAG